MKQVKVSLRRGMEVVEKIEAVVEIKELGAGKIQFDFITHPDSVLCVLQDDAIIFRLEKLPQVLKVEKLELAEKEK